MAIQNRRGKYEDFNPEELLAGELAVVQEGDTSSRTGRSLYICFQPGIVKRIADYEDIQDMVADVAEEYIQDFDDAVDAVTVLIPRTEQAAEAAEEAAEAASAIVSQGNAGLGHAYGVCSTAYDTGAKTVSISGFQLVVGGLVAVRFTNGASTFSTLNINNTGAKNIRYRNITYMTANIGPKDTVLFQYDGVYYQVVAIERAEPIIFDCGTISSLPVTKNSSWVNQNMICIRAELGTPSAQTSDWSIETSDGFLTISGSISGSTTVKLILEYALPITA